MGNRQRTKSKEQRAKSNEQQRTNAHFVVLGTVAGCVNPAFLVDLSHVNVKKAKQMSVNPANNNITNCRRRRRRCRRRRRHRHRHRHRRHAAVVVRGKNA